MLSYSLSNSSHSSTTLPWMEVGLIRLNSLTLLQASRRWRLWTNSTNRHTLQWLSITSIQAKRKEANPLNHKITRTSNNNNNTIKRSKNSNCKAKSEEEAWTTIKTKKEVWFTSIWHRRAQGAFWDQGRIVTVQGRYSILQIKMLSQLFQMEQSLIDKTNKETEKGMKGTQC